MRITLKRGSDAPVYKELADAITAAAVRGEIADGERLPAVRQLASELGIAAGTVKRAYEELGDRGYVRTVPGSGSFLSLPDHSSTSRKERAVRAIDELLDTLDALDFSPREMEIYFGLKLRERTERGAGLRLALVDCSVEALEMFAQQLEELEGVELLKYPLDQLGDTLLRGETELAATTERHYAELRRRCGEGTELVCLAVNTDSRSIMELSRLPEGTKLGITALSPRFAELMEADCRRCTRADGELPVALLGETPSLEAFLAPLDVVVVPGGYARLCSRRQQEELRAFAAEHPLLRLRYQIDRGSLMRLEDAVMRAREQRKNLL